MNWTITDNGNLIQIEHEGLEVFNNPKGDTEIKIVRAKTGDNTSSVDKLYIGFDTSWPCQIPYNDVTVGGEEPTDVSNFSDLVEAILNNVSGGSSTPITVDFLALTKLKVDHAVIEGQVYKYVDTTFLPDSIDHILLTGSGTQTYNNIGKAYVTAIGKYVECDYNIASNKLECILVTEGVFYGGIKPDYVVEKNNLIGTASVSKNAPGDWFITSSYGSEFPVNKTSIVVGPLPCSTSMSFAADQILIGANRYDDSNIWLVSVSGIIGLNDYIGADGIRVEIHVNIGN